MAAPSAPLTTADHAVLRWLVAHRSPGWTAPAKGLMNLGISAFFVGVVLLTALLAAVLVRALRPVLAAGAAAALLSVTASLLLKNLIARPRPPAALALVQAGGYSMPSTDAALVAGLTTAVVLTAWWASRVWHRTATILAATANLVTGIALVYLGVHWPTDVLAGWLLGGTSGAAVGLAVRRWTARHDVRSP